MSERPKPTSAELARLARHHAESLRAAGVEWIPAAAPPSAQQEPGTAASLFGDLTGSCQSA
jgi:hypothetical protein